MVLVINQIPVDGTAAGAPLFGLPGMPESEKASTALPVDGRSWGSSRRRAPSSDSGYSRAGTNSKPPVSWVCIAKRGDRSYQEGSGGSNPTISRVFSQIFECWYRAVYS